MVIRMPLQLAGVPGAGDITRDCARFPGYRSNPSLCISVEITCNEFLLVKREWCIRIILSSDIASLLVQSAVPGVAISEIGRGGGGLSADVHIVPGGLVKLRSSFESWQCICRLIKSP